jgi:ankyrin repeat protein
MGADKIGHFVSKGYILFVEYRKSIRSGTDPATAWQEAVQIGHSDNFFLSEKGLLGYVTSGVFSNADLAADYRGMKFYQNLTQPVTVDGRERPPMLVLQDGRWALAPHVRRDSDFLTTFFTDHFDEALNPSMGEWGMRAPVREAIRERAENLLNWYTDRNGARRPRQWFADRAGELATCDGENYGYQMDEKARISLLDAGLEPFDYGQGPDHRNWRGETALHAAADDGDRVRLAAALDQGLEPDPAVRSDEKYSPEWGSTPLHYAARSGRGEAAALLLSRGANANAANDMGATPLHRAVEWPVVVDVLLERGVDANARDDRGRTPLHWAAAYPTPQVAQRLLAAGADVNAADAQGLTPLHVAARWGNAQVLEVLVQQGGESQRQAAMGITPLHLAAREGHEEAAAVLLRHGAATSADAFGLTPLHTAAAHRKTAVVRRLIEHGADVRAADGGGWTALHHAGRDGVVELAQLLLSHRADPNAPDLQGRSPLHIAAANGHRAMVDTLIHAGGNLRKKDKRGNSPLRLLQEPPYPLYRRLSKSAR